MESTDAPNLPAAPSSPAAHYALRPRPQTPRPAALLLSAVALGGALQVNFGQYHPVAVAGLTVALLGCVLAVAVPQSRCFRALDAKAQWGIAAALCFQFILLLSRSPGATGRLAGDGRGLWTFQAGVLAAAAFTAGALIGKGRRGRACLFAMLLTHAALGLWVLRAAPNPGVDVVTFQRDSAAALMRGVNPYALTFPNPYADPSRYYAPHVVQGDRLAFGFPYPPLSLLMALPGHALGDFRYAQLAAMTLAGAFIALARPGPLATGAAAVLLFTPRGFFVLEAGWTEPFAALLLAGTVFVACRRPGWLPVALGLLVGVKQYLVLALLAAPLLKGSGGQSRGRLLWLPLTVAAAITMPLALWDLPAFIHSAVVLQFRQPFRPDALAYPAALLHATGWPAPAWLGFAVAAASGVLCLAKCPRTPAGFAAALGLVCFVFFAFSKQAFCNYYYLVIAALCCAAGATGAAPPPSAPDAACCDDAAV